MELTRNDPEARGRELVAALERQAATSEILHVIARSRTDALPVFETIVRSAVTLCGSLFANVFRFDGELLHYVASHNIGPSYAELLRVKYPMRPDTSQISGRVILTKSIVRLADVRSDPDYDQRFPGVLGWRRMLGVPMLREGEPIGVITVGWAEAGPVSREQEELLQAFADQAVIAIENVRLFRELEMRNQELTEALEQQTATSEILRVISRTQTSVQPVFDTIVTHATRLCGANFAFVALHQDGRLALAARTACSSEFADYLARGLEINRETTTGRAVLARKPVHVVDFMAEPGMRISGAHRREGVRTNLSVPMLRDDRLLGAITIWRHEVRPFSPNQIALLEIFADQAVIAIENLRLFNSLQLRNRELTEALEQQTATSEILGAISQSPTDAQPVFDTIAAAAMKLCGASSANVFTFDGSLLHAAAIRVIDPGGMEAISRIFPRPPDRGTAASRAVLTRGVVAIEDVLKDPDYQWNEAPRWGFRSALGVPLMREGTPIGALALGRPEPGPFPEQQIALLKTFADQAVIAIENVRLFHELEAKSRQLEIASQHKSAFLANMSHELRTPLNAIIGFTRIVMRRSREQLEAQQYENLEKILASGQHLLSLINAILDLAKVEAGHVEIATQLVHPSRLLEQCLRTVEPLIRDGVQLVRAFDDGLSPMLVDEEKLRQIVINLLSNAARFTSSGAIEVRAREGQGSIAIAVADSGIGIARDKLELIFEEFEQADASSTREHGGTGLGLAIARRLARLMGGDIRAESEPGAGSIFTLTLPVRYQSPQP